LCTMSFLPRARVFRTASSGRVRAQPLHRLVLSAACDTNVTEVDSARRMSRTSGGSAPAAASGWRRWDRPWRPRRSCRPSR
jgi:hypothetical protein